MKTGKKIFKAFIAPLLLLGAFFMLISLCS
jgi:hypothetical protein